MARRQSQLQTIRDLDATIKHFVSGLEVPAFPAVCRILRPSFLCTLVPELRDGRQVNYHQTIRDPEEYADAPAEKQKKWLAGGKLPRKRDLYPKGEYCPPEP